MKPHAISSDSQIAWVRHARIGAVGELLLKSQDPAVVVFRSSRIGNGEDRNGAGDHEVKGEVALAVEKQSNPSGSARAPMDGNPQLRRRGDSGVG